MTAIYIIVVIIAIVEGYNAWRRKQFEDRVLAILNDMTRTLYVIATKDFKNKK